MHAAGERLHIQGLGILPVDPVFDAAQPREIAQMLRLGGTASHLRDRKRQSSCLGPTVGNARAARRRISSLEAWVSRRPK